MAQRDPRLLTVQDTPEGQVRTLHRDGCPHALGTRVRLDERGFGKLPATRRQPKRRCACLGHERSADPRA